jgi:2-desacetyl-2-hydroxyethyl bacteriochlorophyllide A dehydrogenase
MRALWIDGPGRVRLGEVAESEPGPGELLLRIRTVGFCGSDLNTFRGRNPLVSYPRIPGHEIAATIEGVGAGVPDSFREGLDVTVVPYTACGRCPACRRGRVNACRDNQTLGVQRDGALRERIVVPWEKVVCVERLSLRELALVEPLSVGARAIDRARVEAGEVVAVLGCGAVGLGAVAAAAARGATVVAVDVDDRKLEIARKAGAAHVIDSATSSLTEQLRELTSGDGPAVVVEAVGLPETFVAAVSEVAFAGRVVYIGYAGAPVTYDTAQFVKKELDILGSRNATLEDFRAVIRMLERGAFPVNDAVTRVVPFEEAGEALRAWAADPRAVTRIHVDLT